MNQEHRHTEEIDFRDLIRKPRKLFGYAYIYFVVALVALGWLYISNLSVVGKNSVQPAVFADSAARVTDIPFQNPRQIPPVDVMSAGLPSPEAISKGRELFKANCASCHGENGEGNGPSGLVLNPKPRNFHQLSGWTNGSKVSQMYKTLQEGIVRNGMASYSYLPPADRFALIHYIRAFVAGHPVDSPDELRQLDMAYQLAKGMVVPGQIPVAKALRTVAGESGELTTRVQQAVRRADASPSPAAELFHSYTSNEARVFTALYHNPHLLAAPETLATYVSGNPGQIGFKAGISHLAAEDWVKIHAFLTGVF